jgi:RNA polymerase sigma factor (sigma-70 family)
MIDPNRAVELVISQLGARIESTARALASRIKGMVATIDYDDLYNAGLWSVSKLVAARLDDPNGVIGSSNYYGAVAKNKMIDLIRSASGWQRRHNGTQNESLNSICCESLPAKFEEFAGDVSGADDFEIFVRRMLPLATPREMLILKRYFFEGESRRSIAMELGITKSRLSQIISECFEQVRVRNI